MSQVIQFGIPTLDRLLGREEARSPLLGVGDLRDPRGLAERLNSPDPVASHVKRIGQRITEPQLPLDGEKALTLLNAIIQEEQTVFGPSLQQMLDHFSGPTLDLYEFHRRAPARVDVHRLNRLLLEEAFPGSICELERPGIQVPESHHNPHLPSTVSMCILGPDGTGKSVLGLHLASNYCSDTNGRSMVFYASTDLAYPKANVIWKKFGLDVPDLRVVPFHERKRGWQPRKDFDVPLVVTDIYNSEGGGASTPLTKYLLESRGAPAAGCPPSVAFVNLEARTAGDDWGFLNRLTAALETPGKDAPPHLLIIDAVEGLETMTGERDAFGQPRSRRSRIAQVLRLAAGKCHVLFIVEEPKEGERLPEEFVTDVVIRLRAVPKYGYSRRNIEVVKARGQAHVRGQHTYVIRSGEGSTTARAENPDDPRIVLSGNRVQSYFHVFPSLHSITRQEMQSRVPLSGTDASGRGEVPFAGFGIPHLDEILAQREGASGLPTGKLTVLIGDDGTHKSRLGRAFLSRCFAPLSEELREAFHQVLNRPKGQKPYSDGEVLNALEKLEDFNKGKLTLGYSALPQILRGIDPGALAARKKLHRDNRMLGAAILLTTQDLNVYRPKPLDLDSPSAKVAKHLLPPSLVRHTGLGESVRKLNSMLAGEIDGNLIYRRMEIHDNNPSAFFHTIQSAIERAKQIVDGPGWLREKRSPNADMIRLVFDDWSIIQDTYPDIQADPLFLPFLNFYLVRETVSTLLIDTQPGGPDQIIPTEVDRELRSLARHHIYTWNVPFFGERRVAISVIPPITDQSPSVVRELRPARPSDDERLEVDPHFELYTGLEQGKPSLAPLNIRLHSEAPSCAPFVREMNTLFQDLLQQTGEVVTCDHAESYERLRDAVSLRTETRLGSTLVFQVDDFWTRNSQNFLPLADYLNTDIGNPMNDPLRVFKGTEGNRRSNAFKPVGYETLPEDRLPYQWDFGFLLCRERAWEAAASKVLPYADGGEQVGDVWERLVKPGNGSGPDRADHVSWKDFLVAATVVARQQERLIEAGPVPAFDLPLGALENFSCLVLEIWASEIYTTLGKRARALLPPERQASPGAGLVYLLTNYPGELYKAWLLMGEVFGPPQFPSKGFDFEKRRVHGSAVAARHWYSTAVEEMREWDPSDAKVPAGLPGRYSARGDWFLAVARGSRSNRLGYQALDLFSTQSGNVRRLQQGIGLPTRLPQRQPGGYPDDNDSLRTMLILPTNQEVDRKSWVSYSQLLKLGARSNDNPSQNPEGTGQKRIYDGIGRVDFYWLWRSNMENYDQHTRIWIRWLRRVLANWGTWRASDKNNRNGFELYSEMGKKPRDVEANTSHTEFQRMLEWLVETLNTTHSGTEDR